MLIPYQSCRSNEGWVPIRVASSKPPLDYTVLVPPWGQNPRECICECTGYTYHGHCRHQEIAFENLCRWDALNGNEKRGPKEQTQAQQEMKICPACGGPTSWQMEVVDDEDGN